MYELQVGDEIIINESAEASYLWSVPGSIGTILSITSEHYFIYFPQIAKCDSKYGWPIDQKHCSPRTPVYGPPQSPIIEKLKIMEQRWKNHCASLI